LALACLLRDPISRLCFSPYGCTAPMLDATSNRSRRQSNANGLGWLRCRVGDAVKVGAFEFPDDLFYLVEHQVWARLHDDGLATLGITSLGVHQAGEIYMCRPKLVGTAVEQGRSIAVVELAKSIVSVKSAVGGVVVDINPLLAAEPQRVHLDPYGDGWLARLRVTSFDADRVALVHGDAVRAAMEHCLWLDGPA
jgi:glycine cleavage system H protein